MVSKETVLLVLAFIWGAYAMVIGLAAIIHGYNNDLVWVTIIAAISGTTGAHIGLSMSKAGLSLQTSGAVQTPKTPVQT